MNTQSLGGLGVIPIVLLKHSFDKPLLEFQDCVSEENIMVNHLTD